jgi:colicin import membrane protein
MNNRLALPLICASALALAFAAGLGACTPGLQPTTMAPQVPVTETLEQAELKLEQVRSQRAATEARYANSEVTCYEKFFVNDCLDEAREYRRVTLAYLNAVEDEAKHFQRKASADTRDAAVAESIRAAEADEARLAANPAPLPVAPAPKVRKPSTRPSLQARQEAQAAKLATIAAEERAALPERAANAEAFAQKRIDSEKRQRKVEEKKAASAKKAEKAAEKAVKDAEAAKAKDVKLSK